MTHQPKRKSTSSRSQRTSLRRTAPVRVALLATLALSVTACTTTVPGAASHANGMRSDVSDADFTVNLAGDSETDVISRNALADVVDYWAVTYPDIFGAEFQALEGGFWSIDPDETDPQDLPDSNCFDDLEGLSDNAYYCPGDDAIYFDRAWMAGLAEDFGTFVIAEIMAHEMAHAVQSRANIDNVNSDRLYTQEEFTAEERANRGNLPYDDSLALAAQTLEIYWEQAFGPGYAGDDPLDGDLVPPQVTGFDGEQPACAGQSQDRLVHSRAVRRRGQWGPGGSVAG